MTQSQSNLLAMPANPARLILEADGIMIKNLLKRSEFIKYCDQRDLKVNAERLTRFEKLGIFKPLLRFFHTDERESRLTFPNADVDEYFGNGWIIDTTNIKSQYEVPDVRDKNSEAFYSIFQIDQLSLTLNEMSLNVHLDSYLLEKSDNYDWNTFGKKCTEFAEMHLDFSAGHEFRCALSILCQYISNRYFPHTQGNKRVISIPQHFSQNEWISISGNRWDWYEYRHNFDPKDVEKKFGLTPKILKHAYTTIGGSASFCDPLDKWANLVEFVALKKKQELKGKALRAQSYRDAANMLRMLHKDLYDEELRPTHQIFGQVINHFPELEAREDTRVHLEFVVNQYDLNPQPKLVLFVEGESEVILISVLFDKYFGSHPGVSGIEIVNLQGVNNATGNYKKDRFRAIFRLIDYLHHHQTLTFLILDNENNAGRLKEYAQKDKSLHGQDRKAIPHDHIQLWKVSLEFDNFSNTELAQAFNTITQDKFGFKNFEINRARLSENPGKSLSELYKARTSYSLNKPELAKILGDIIVAPKSRKSPENRPIMKHLDRIQQLAARNPFPTRRKSWVINQESSFLG